MFASLQSDINKGVDLEAYFQRIGYNGDYPATIASLQEIHRLHAQSIAFENFDYLLRIPILLDIESIQYKLVQCGRGGGCYEQNLLLEHVLKKIGFGITGIAARVLWQVPEAIITPRNHRLILVDVQGELCIADVGFIGMTPPAPIFLRPGIEQKTSHETFMIIKKGEEFILQAQIQGAWRPVYQFSLQEQLLPDDEANNWYHANYPTSFVIHDLIAAIVSPDCRYIFHNTRLTEYHSNGRIERKNITDPEILLGILENIFGLIIPEKLDLASVLQQFLQTKY